ncbi:NLI interacting factor-like phosphatase-domain-containing protein [Melanogaster broomeanus]|nr:NLI interacting factor-like phosphatase-domain-containing protein [Melanogaster broomeanus]
MNSLAYISRQFDVLATARTPPSTPVDEPAEFLPQRPGVWRRGSHSGDSLRRTSAWSDKSFPDSLDTPGPSRPKRSYSSPSGFLHIPFPPPPISDSPVRTEPTLRLRSAWRRLIFVRVFVTVWNTICATWASWTPGEIVDKDKEPVVGNIVEEKLREFKREDADIPPPGTQPLLLPLPDSIPQHPYADALPDLRGLHSRTALGSLPTPPPSPGPVSPPPPTSQSPPGTTTEAPREHTPTITAHKTPFHLPKTLVLDLDETLIHSTSKEMSLSSGGFGLLGFGRRNMGHTVEVVLGDHSTLYHVYKRPFVDYFLRKVSGWYTLVVFTASMPEYADPVIDWLDAGRGILARRFFRESCTLLPNGSYTKDLSLIEQDLSRVCLVDNSPISYRVNEANGIPIEGWTHDPHDEALLDLLPILDSLRFTSDVRRVLGLRGFAPS